MRFDASPPVCYVRLYRLCSLVPSPVFNHIFAFLSVLLCPPLSSRSRPFSSLSPAVCPHLPVPPSAPISQSHRLPPSLSPTVCPHLPVPPSAPISQSHRLSPSLSPTVCPHLPVPPSVPISLSVPCHPAQRSTSASNPVRTQSVHSLPLGGSFGRNRAIDYPSGRNRGRIRPFRPPNHGFRPNEPHSRATHPRIRSPTRLVLGQGKRLDCANG